jgi:hypothetical protein
MSSGGQRIVTNCGAPQRTGEALSEAARATAAHSTVTVDRLSSAEFLTLSGSGLERSLARRLLRRLGPVILRGPGPVAVERGEQGGWQRLRARHDGYVRAFGLFHERRWQLSPDGDQLAGEDVFTGEGMTAREAAIRFPPRSRGSWRRRQGTPFSSRFPTARPGGSRRRAPRRRSPRAPSSPRATAPAGRIRSWSRSTPGRRPPPLEFYAG